MNLLYFQKSSLNKPQKVKFKGITSQVNNFFQQLPPIHFVVTQINKWGSSKVRVLRLNRYGILNITLTKKTTKTKAKTLKKYCTTEDLFLGQINFSFSYDQISQVIILNSETLQLIYANKSSTIYKHDYAILIAQEITCRCEVWNSRYMTLVQFTKTTVLSLLFTKSSHNKRKKIIEIKKKKNEESKKDNSLKNGNKKIQKIEKKKSTTNLTKIDEDFYILKDQCFEILIQKRNVEEILDKTFKKQPFKFLFSPKQQINKTELENIKQNHKNKKDKNTNPNNDEIENEKENEKSDENLKIQNEKNENNMINGKKLINNDNQIGNTEKKGAIEQNDLKEKKIERIKKNNIKGTENESKKKENFTINENNVMDNNNNKEKETENEKSDENLKIQNEKNESNIKNGKKIIKNDNQICIEEKEGETEENDLKEKKIEKLKKNNINEKEKEKEKEKENEKEKKNENEKENEKENENEKEKEKEKENENEKNVINNLKIFKFFSCTHIIALERNSIYNFMIKSVVDQIIFDTTNEILDKIDYFVKNFIKICSSKELVFGNIKKFLRALRAKILREHEYKLNILSTLDFTEERAKKFIRDLVEKRTEKIVIVPIYRELVECLMKFNKKGQELIDAGIIDNSKYFTQKRAGIIEELISSSRWKIPITNLKRLNHTVLPSEQLKIISETGDLIVETVNDEDLNGKLLNADNFIYIFYYILMKSKITYLESRIDVIQNLSPEKQLNVKDGFYLTTILAAVPLIKQQYRVKRENKLKKKNNTENNGGGILGEQGNEITKKMKLVEKEQQEKKDEEQLIQNKNSQQKNKNERLN
ncbi:hypothetical protein M0813_07009 [Anaeramoeba flamelloides]|uniref:VPS9 domain-containing protein n=1 Tax=Anaeramoeba flamelloides TaxID=1746091 RepID=A0ABQ8XDI3_9EUKA|nr:hypothetical protein M0813_07009 [Anaeramoeba flamelloides]